MGRCGLRLRSVTTSIPLQSFSTRPAATTLNCGSRAPRRWPRRLTPSIPRNAASAWSTFCWRPAFPTTRFPCPPITLSSSPPAEAPVVTEAYRKGREALDAAVNRILVRAGVSLTPSLVVALVDGGAVKAISEGYDVREIARMLLDSAVALG